MKMQILGLVFKRVAVVGATVCGGFIFAILVLTFFGGRGQLYSPEYVEHRLALGMSVEQIAYQLGPMQDFTKEKLKTGYRLQLSECGLGAWLVPQHEVWLEFDKTGHLMSGYATLVYQLSDRTMGLKLDRAHTKIGDRALFE